MKIISRFKTYNLNFINNLNEIYELAKKKETYFVIDSKIITLYRKVLNNIPADRLFILESIETKKNMTTVLDICEKMTCMSSKRNTHLVSIGGGIVQDVTGFVACSLYRGVKWTFYPSTLLAASDSCIGGKTSLNYKGFKNLLGSFYPPDDIRIYPEFFHTLTSLDYDSGLGEVVKFNVIAGEDKFAKIEKDIDAILAHDYNKLEEYMESSLEFKKKFIEEDEFDKGIRILLNFAHTFGHAYEVACNYAIPHGSAVALGMITANNISVQRGFMNKEYSGRIENVCKKILVNIKLNKEWLELDEILIAIHKDKKQTSTDITAVLVKADNSLGVFHDIQEDEIAKAIEHLRNVMY